ncbi:MAG: hypothetical protein JWM93_2508, partial [Frankiales bacterium]|nr:hypothetical protein [Frankiales bacterium]
FKQLNSNFHEGYLNCNKFSNYFMQRKVCQPWCAVFAWYVWTAAGVPSAKQFESSYTDDFEDEWRVNFKPLGGPRKPEKGDVVVWSHRTNGINGHVGVVVAVDGWNIRMIHGNWTDTVLYSPWTNPFTRTADHGAKRVIGFASPV